MSAVNDRGETLRAAEEISEMKHFSQETLDLLRERTEDGPLLLTGSRGGGAAYSRLSQYLLAQRTLARLQYRRSHS
jgi:hypothetical protein